METINVVTSTTVGNEYVLVGMRIADKKTFRYTCGSIAVAEAYANKHKDDIVFDKLLKISTEIVKEF